MRINIYIKKKRRRKQNQMLLASINLKKKIGNYV